MCGVDELKQQVGFRAHDHVVEGLETERAHVVAADLGCSVRGHLGIDEHGRTCCFGEQLRLAGTLHRNEPVDGFVDVLPDGETYCPTVSRP